MHTKFWLRPAFRVLSILLFSAAFCQLMPQAMGQTRISSPYSLFGVGELKFNQNIRNMGMGGIGVAVRSNSMVNDVNPASYTAADSLSFIFEANVVSHGYAQRTLTENQSSNYTSLGNLGFAFPVTRWWAAGFGLKPFSDVGYRVLDSGFDDQIGQMNMLYEGSGGIHQAFVGTAFTPFKGLSLGMNAAYLFGSMNRHATVYSDSVDVYLTNKIDGNQVSGWQFGFGAQYEFTPSETSAYTLGLIWGPPQTVGVTRVETIRRIIPGGSIFDTISHREALQGNMSLPAFYGAGLYGRFNHHWQGGIDFQYQNWESYELFDTPGGLNNSWQLAAGMQHRPAVQTFSSLFGRMQYRAGLRYGQTYLNVNDQQIHEFGINFGVGIPIRRSLSALNLSVEYGRRGTTDNGLIREDFFRVNVGVNVVERWFVRRRFF